MERRFRQRTDRPGAEPPAADSESQDDRVQEEMLQFFSESTQILEEIVPSLKQGDEALADTTGEIRRKIDAFFGDSGASGMIRAERAISPTETVGPSTHEMEPAPAPSPAAPPPAARRPERPAAGNGGAKMDLRTALERLRRHGVVRDEEPSFSATSPMSSSRLSPVAEPDPPPPPRPAPPPAEQPPSQPAPAASSPVVAAPPPGLQRSPRFAPPPSAEPPAAPAPAAAEDPFAPPPTPPPAFVPRTEPPPAQAAPREAAPAPPAYREPAPAPPPEPRILRSPAPTPPPPAPAVETPRSAPSAEKRVSPVEPLPPVSGASEGFDAIFAEVEGLVRGTLADSIEETMEEARVGEDTMRSQQLAAASARMQHKFAPPRDDEFDEEDEEESAPAGPYNWGVQAANRPAGAWLLEDGAEDAVRARLQQRVGQDSDEVGVAAPPPAPRRRPPTEEVEPVERPAPRAAPPVSEPVEAPSGGGAAGATGLLARKLEAEAARLGPIVDQLMEKGVLTGADLGMDEGDEDDDDEISVAEFVDDRPREEAMGVTPMKIVEEIRRLRKIQDLLMSKGLVSESELSAPGSSDG